MSHSTILLVYLYSYWLNIDVPIRSSVIPVLIWWFCQRMFGSILSMSWGSGQIFRSSYSYDSRRSTIDGRNYLLRLPHLKWTVSRPRRNIERLSALIWINILWRPTVHTRLFASMSKRFASMSTNGRTDIVNFSRLIVVDCLPLLILLNYMYFSYAIARCDLFRCKFSLLDSLLSACR